ncbi:MAG: GntR family transcriptional regulator [Blautia sp.]|nr:GntR family transcriptional regulator [Blautia sp.]
MIVVGRNPKESHADYTYRVLRENILKLHMKPGEMVSEKLIADQLDVSRTPVHEAVLRLKEEGLIEIKARKESRVSYFSMDMINEGFFLRCNMDAVVLKLAAGRTSADLRRKMQDSLAEQKVFLEKKNFGEFLECDDRFHQLIYQAADKPICYKVVYNMSTHLSRMRYLLQILGQYEYIPMSYEEHKKMMDMIAFGMPEDFPVYDFAREHMRGIQKLLPAIESSYREYFQY